MPLLGDPGHQEYVVFMKMLPGHLIKPEAILVISAHWEAVVPTLINSAQPELLYDYYGFPAESYQITYHCAGSPTLAGEIAKALVAAGLEVEFDSNRGLDHGVFIPLKLMYPQADIPVVQLSLVKGLDPQTHIALGRALSNLKTKNLLVIGSGFSFHNLNAFFDDSKDLDQANDAFQDWLLETCTRKSTLTERDSKLLDWELAPNARLCHPRSEHLLPLHICVGLAGTPAALLFDGQILGKRCLSFGW